MKAQPPLTPRELLEAQGLKIDLLSLSLYLPEYLRNKGEMSAAATVEGLMRFHCRVELNMKNSRAPFEGLE